MAMCYVARKSCGCIVAAFPVAMDPKRSAEILKQMVLSGYSVEQAPEYDVRYGFRITCDHNRPPLLDIADKKVDAVTGEVIPAEGSDWQAEDQGADSADVEAMAEDWQGDGEEPEPVELPEQAEINF